MLSLSLPGRVFLCTLPTDMRKSFDSLAGLVEQQHWFIQAAERE